MNILHAASSQSTGGELTVEQFHKYLGQLISQGRGDHDIMLGDRKGFTSPIWYIHVDTDVQEIVLT